MIKITKLEKNLSHDFTLKISELYIENGERVAVIGPNGSGKSTLLRLLAGIIKPDSGKIEIDGRTGYEPQNPYAFKGTTEYNIKLGADKKADIESIIDECALSQLKNKNVSELSGGEKQRMCFARMLAGGFDTLLLDEPFSAVDIETGAKLGAYLAGECKKRKTTLIMTTHTPSQALNIATKILIMNGGEISEYSDIAELKNPQSEFGRKFIEQWRL